jgi:hypothetical protein
MRNFHRDFEALNSAYDQKINKPPCECQLNEAVSDDIADIHRKGSSRQLREALSKLADAHHKDHSSLTYEDVYNEMKVYAEEKLMPEPVVPVPDQSPMAASGMHNPSPMGIATEDTVDETNHATLRAAQTDEENEADDRKKARQDAQNKIMKKDLEDEEAEVTKEGTDGKTDDLTDSEKEKLKKYAGEEEEEEEEVEEEFSLEQKIAMLKASDGLEEAGPGDVQDMSKVTGVDQRLIKTAKSLAGGKGRGGMLGRNPEKVVQKSYGNLMKAVAGKLNDQIKNLNKPAQPTP